ncbi:MAG: hypothetical protein KBE04_03535 [Phycisphaerae bacterium]|nr:hypothetical protein [Phycisphaerae bacterium]
MATLHPILLSAITCNRVILDKVTGMPSVIDIVQAINAWRYPARCPQIVFFCELTNGHGTTAVKVRLVDSQDDDKVIFEKDGNVAFEDVRQIVTLAMDLHGVMFPAPGEYRFQLFTGGDLLGERRVVCRKVVPPQDAKPEEQARG